MINRISNEGFLKYRTLKKIFTATKQYRLTNFHLKHVLALHICIYTSRYPFRNRSGRHIAWLTQVCFIFISCDCIIWNIILCRVWFDIRSYVAYIYKCIYSNACASSHALTKVWLPLSFILRDKVSPQLMKFYVCAVTLAELNVLSLH